MFSGAASRTGCGSTGRITSRARRREARLVAAVRQDLWGDERGVRGGGADRCRRWTFFSKSPDRARRQAAFEAVAARRLADREAIETHLRADAGPYASEMAREAGFKDLPGLRVRVPRAVRLHAGRIACASTTPSSNRSCRLRRRIARASGGGSSAWTCCGPGTSTWTRRGTRRCGRSRMRRTSRAARRRLFTRFDRTDAARTSPLMERDGLLDLGSRRGQSAGRVPADAQRGARCRSSFMNAAGHAGATCARWSTRRGTRSTRWRRASSVRRRYRKRAYRVLRGGVDGDGTALRAAVRGILPGASLRRMRSARGQELSRRHRRSVGVGGGGRRVPALALHAPGTHSREAAGCALDGTGSSDLAAERIGPPVAEARRYFWQRQLHFFQVPFYYVEYGIAQLGALQLWQRSRRDPTGAAMEGYYDGLKLGGVQAIAGTVCGGRDCGSIFRRETLRPLMDDLQQIRANSGSIKP